MQIIDTFINKGLNQKYLNPIFFFIIEKKFTLTFKNFSLMTYTVYFHVEVFFWLQSDTSAKKFAKLIFKNKKYSQISKITLILQ